MLRVCCAPSSCSAATRVCFERRLSDVYLQLHAQCPLSMHVGSCAVARTFITCPFMNLRTNDQQHARALWNRSLTNISHVSALTFLTLLTSDTCGSNIPLKNQRLTPS